MRPWSIKADILQRMASVMRVSESLERKGGSLAFSSNVSFSERFVVRIPTDGWSTCREATNGTFYLCWAVGSGFVPHQRRSCQWKRMGCIVVLYVHKRCPHRDGWRYEFQQLYKHPKKILCYPRSSKAGTLIAVPISLVLAMSWRWMQAPVQSMWKSMLRGRSTNEFSAWPTHPIWTVYGSRWLVPVWVFYRSLFHSYAH